MKKGTLNLVILRFRVLLFNSWDFFRIGKKKKVRLRKRILFLNVAITRFSAFLLGTVEPGEPLGAYLGRFVLLVVLGVRIELRSNLAGGIRDATVPMGLARLEHGVVEVGLRLGEGVLERLLVAVELLDVVAQCREAVGVVQQVAQGGRLQLQAEVVVGLGSLVDPALLGVVVLLGARVDPHFWVLALSL